MPSVPLALAVADVGAGIPGAMASGLGHPLAHLLHQDGQVAAAGMAVSGGALNDDLGL